MEKNHRTARQERLFLVGGCITMGYLLCLAMVKWCCAMPDVGLGLKAFRDLAPNEAGDFLAGVFAPLAFAWFAISCFQQGKALRNQQEEIRLQTVELQNSIAEMQSGNEVARNNASHVQKDVFLAESELYLKAMEVDLMEIARIVSNTSSSIIYDDYREHNQRNVFFLAALIKNTFSDTWIPKGIKTALEAASYNPYNLHILRFMDYFRNLVNKSLLLEDKSLFAFYFRSELGGLFHGYLLSMPEQGPFGSLTVEYNKWYGEKSAASTTIDTIKWPA